MSYVKILDGTAEDTPDPAIQFNFPLDNFQKHSFNCISKDQNVLVTAHTGSGKTAVAKYAVAHYIKKGKKIIYTSPIKALSNQKYKEFKEEFEDNFSKLIGHPVSVGIMTGDNKIKPDADCVIMTTEILRNALYEVGEKSKYFQNDFTSTLGCVIFDEVHYINDKDRGHTWEETIILLKPEVTLIMLSATIDKPEEFAQWIGSQKNKVVNLIPTTTRAVPLEHYIYTDYNLFKILDSHNKFQDQSFDKALKAYNPLQKNRLTELVQFLKEKNMFQTIFFSFSRVNCERYAKSVTLELITYQERSEIEALFNKYMHKYHKQYEHVQQYSQIKDLLLKGVAYHHSGLIPILKEVVEIIFQKGLIKILFATETFAVGVNMPTRTVVFTELEKPTEESKRLLTTEEYRQMAGRAGRRGIDKIGYVIILPQYSFPDKQELKGAMLGKVKHISSNFMIDYSFMLKILQSRSTNFDAFMDASMFKKDNTKFLEEEQQNYTKLKQQVQYLETTFGDITPFEGLAKIDAQEQEYKTMGFSLNKQQQKEKARLLKQLKDPNKYHEYKQFTKQKDQLHKLEETLQLYQNTITTTSATVLDVLIKADYVTPSKTITMKGILAAQINECNSLLLTEIITRKLFDNLSPQEIAAVLAIFLDDTVNKEEITSTRQITCSPNVRSVISTVEGIINEFQTLEHECGVELTDYNFWNIYYNYVDAVYDWTDGKPLAAILANLQIYEGNFVRNMLKISNIAKDLVYISYTFGNLVIIPQLEKINSLIIRDIVTVNSLYIA
jgi:superfamily II RNA helicase